MSKRYGVLPSEFLKLSVQDLQFNILSASLGTQEETKQMEKSQRKQRMRGK
jgi:hypothetical protein